MPKKMFFNIPETKQNMIIDIATEEFTSKSFEEVSVSSIIRSANIPRGSFYTYFEDLHDLFNFIISKIKEERLLYAQDIISTSNRDFFIFIKTLFIYDFDSYLSKHRYSLFRNYIHYIQTVKKGSLKDDFINPLSGFLKESKTFDEIFDIDKYGINLSEFVDIIEMVLIIMINTFLKSESENMSKEEVISLFNRRINLIESGVKKIQKETLL